MKTKIQRWENGLGILVPEELLDDLGLSVGDEVNVTLRKGSIIITHRLPYRKRKDLQKLVAYVQDTNARDTDWGTPTGREVW